MALVYCRECGTKISEYAPKCPKCGAEQNLQTTQSFPNVKVKQKKSNKNNINKSNTIVKHRIIGIVVILIGVVGYLLYSKFYGNTINGYEYVDLGLSVKWATCNVGASESEEYGDYYAWGETTTKISYDVDNSKTYGKNFEDISGNQNHDVARANWGKTWRIPTKVEMEELESKCTWTWTAKSGTNGYKVTGPNGNSIFLPAAGYCNGTSHNDVGEYGDYWSSSPNEGNDDLACDLFFNSGCHNVYCYRRDLGRTVRPVSE